MLFIILPYREVIIFCAQIYIWLECLHFKFTCSDSKVMSMLSVSRSPPGDKLGHIPSRAEALMGVLTRQFISVQPLFIW